MRAYTLGFLLTSLLFSSFNVSALTSTEERYVKIFVEGNPASTRNAAKSIFRIANVDPYVYDVIAERLLTDHKSVPNQSRPVDALSWMSAALGNSGNTRYLGVLKEVRENAGHRKVRAHASKWYKKLKRSKTQAEPYVQGTIDLQRLRADAVSSISSVEADWGREEVAAVKGELAPISEVQEGMSYDDVYSLCGPPTSSSGNITGKAWKPFNFSGKGAFRTNSYYEGQGVVVFENDSAYSAGNHVVEVVIDKFESGYR